MLCNLYTRTCLDYVLILNYLVINYIPLCCRCATSQPKWQVIWVLKNIKLLSDYNIWHIRLLIIAINKILINSYCAIRTCLYRERFRFLSRYATRPHRAPYFLTVPHSTISTKAVKPVAAHLPFYYILSLALFPYLPVYIYSPEIISFGSFYSPF